MRDEHPYSRAALAYIKAHENKVHVVEEPAPEWFAWLDYWKAHGIHHAYNVKVGKADVPTLWPSEFDPKWKGR